MKRRHFLRQTGLVGGSIAGLLSLTGRSQPVAADELLAALSSRSASTPREFMTVDPASPSFKSLIQGFNGRWNAPNAQRIYLPLTESGVEAATAQAIADGFGDTLRVRGGGHCYEDFVFNPAVAAILDLSLLNTVGFDSDRHVFFAQGGATNFDLQHALIRFGKTLPGGSCPTVGLGGHVCGGGYGVLSPLYGLTVDWLSGVSLVHRRDGSPRAIQVGKASTGPEADLFWAHTGGGGGNFGIITRYEFADLPAAPVSAEVQIYAWDWAHIRQKGPEFLVRIVRFFESLTQSLGTTAFVILKLSHADSGQIQLLIQNVHLEAQRSTPVFQKKLAEALTDHGLEQTARKLNSLAGHPAPFKPKSSQDLTWWEAITFYGASGGPMNGKYKSAYMRQGFSEEDIRKIYRHLTRKMRGADGRLVSMKDSLLQVDSYGGKINAVPRNATAVWQRDSIYKLQFQTYWPIDRDLSSQEAGGAPNLHWIRDFYKDLYAASGGIPDPLADPEHRVDGCYINYPDVDLNQYGRLKALQLYYGGHLDRLIQTKASWDPSNLFSHAQSIPITKNY
jgi:hypothetical protein